MEEFIESMRECAFISQPSINILCDHIDRLREALKKLEQWDMLTLDAEGHGIATQDAPWARQLIAEALK